MDPCQNIVDTLARLKGQLARAPPDPPVDPTHPQKPQKPTGLDINALKRQITQTETELDACRKAHRAFTIRGTVPPPGGALTEFDMAMEDFCRANDARACQLTILKDGVVKFAHAYTLGDSPHYITEVDSIFRVASISKAFTCAAIQTLLDKRLLTLTDKVFPLLGIQKKALASQTPDPDIDNITIGDLVFHLGGWNDADPANDPKFVGVPGGFQQIPSSKYDPCFEIRDIAIKLDLPGPPTKMDVARFMYGEPLQFRPGTPLIDVPIGGPGDVPKPVLGFAYSNFGYLLLGLVVERKSGMPYVDYVRQEVLQPIGITDVFLARMLAGRLPREVHYEDAATGPNAKEPHASITAPAAYGGGGFITELMDSAIGLAMTATAIAQFANKYMIWGLGHGRLIGSDRAGGMAGTSAFGRSHSATIDYAFTFNTRTFPARPLQKDQPDPAFDALRNMLEHLLSTASL